LTPLSNLKWDKLGSTKILNVCKDEIVFFVDEEVGLVGG